MSNTSTPSRKDVPINLAYPGMAVAFLASASQANGQIVYTDLDPDEVLIMASYDIDFDNDGTPDLNIFHSMSGTSVAAVVGMVNGGILGSAVSLGSSFVIPIPHVLSSGQPIDASNADWINIGTGLLVLQNSSFGFGQWNGQAGYLGVRFIGGGGQAHYGWVELEVTPGCTQVTVKGYAYESAGNTAIDAGDTGTSTGIQGVEEDLIVSLYPNPAVDQLFVGGVIGTMDVRIISATGQVAQASRITLADVSDRTALDIAALPAGAYVLEVVRGDRMERSEFMKL